MNGSRWVRAHQAPIGGVSQEGRARLEENLPSRTWLYALLFAGIGAFALILLQNAYSARTLDSGLHFTPTMAFPAESWETAMPESVGVDSGELEDAISWFRKRAPADGVNELAIIRYGKLIWAGPGVDNVHGVWSMTKTFSGTVLCALADDGICHPDTPVADILPELEANYPDVTLRHFVTMSSGYEAEGDWPPAIPTYRNGSSTTPFTPAPKPQFAPGTHFSYWDSAMNLYSLAVTKAAGESLESIFSRRIAGPIGMNPDAWSWGKFTQVDGVIVNGGSGNKGKDIEISARELARFGHLMLNRGRWDGQQLLSERWVDEAISQQVPADTPLGGPIKHLYGERFPFDGRGSYGFNWWVNGETANGRLFWPGAPEGTFGAIGYNNNRLFVIPEWNMVVVRLGLDGKDRRIQRDEFAGFLKRIGKAIEN